jgi:retron-type reverse transcriptase
LKRIGNLFDQAFSRESLHQAWIDASHGKMKKRACLEFSRRLASNLDALYDELNQGIYKPMPYIEFHVYEPKKRIIYAPAFRDLVVQHAIYRLVYPIFNSGFIDQSFACRHGKGTHKAADYAQASLRSVDPKTCVMKLDIRKFFYRIDRSILRVLIERRIKDRRFVGVMLQFAEYGHPKAEPLGIPIGNLLSQLYALIYMSPLDHFMKRELNAHFYCRYVDDFVVFGWSKTECLNALVKIKEFLSLRLHLELSRYSIHPVQRGLNFVGYRTWRTRRYIRKHSLFKFGRAVRQGNLAPITSILGHARNTCSLKHLVSTVKEKNHDLYCLLPKVYRCSDNQRTAAARGRKSTTSRN